MSPIEISSRNHWLYRLKRFVSAASNIYSSDEEGSDIETHRPKKNIKGKVLKDSDDESNSGSSAGSGGDDNQVDDASD